MSASEREALSGRNAILMLLTDDEIARVTTAEAGAGLAAGSEFVDLEHLEKGIQQVAGMTAEMMANVIPRNAVGSDTWTKIVSHLAT